MGNETYQHECTFEGCEEFHSTDCVIHQDAITYLGLEAGATSTEIISKLVGAVQNLQTQINNLETRVTALEP